MKINIELDNYKCDNLLAMHGYIAEEVIAYFHVGQDPYNDDNSESDLRGTKIKVAYHPLDRPKELNKNHPMLNILQEYEYDRVVTELFNSRLCDVLFGN